MLLIIKGKNVPKPSWENADLFPIRQYFFKYVPIVKVTVV